MYGANISLPFPPKKIIIKFLSELNLTYTDAFQQKRRGRFDITQKTPTTYGYPQKLLCFPPKPSKPRALTPSTPPPNPTGLPQIPAISPKSPRLPPKSR